LRDESGRFYGLEIPPTFPTPGIYEKDSHSSARSIHCFGRGLDLVAPFANAGRRYDGATHASFGTGRTFVFFEGSSRYRRNGRSFPIGEDFYRRRSRLAHRRTASGAGFPGMDGAVFEGDRR
jgi:hypothetical protein